MAGLLHDMGYESTRRPQSIRWWGPRSSEKRGYPEDVLHAIKGHADYLDVPRDTLMSKTLYAVDELSGSSLPWRSCAPSARGHEGEERAQEVEAEVLRRCRDRDDIVRGAEELGVT